MKHQKRGSIRSENRRTCTAGYQPATESLCLGRMGAGEAAPEKVTCELKTDMCTAGYQPGSESLCLGRMCVGKRGIGKGILYPKREDQKKKSKIMKGHTEQGK